MFAASIHKSKLTFSSKGRISKGPLNSLLNWIEGYVLTDSFDAVVRTSFSSQTRNEALRKNVRDLIDVLIYQAYVPFDYQRTYALKDSFMVEAGTPKDPMLPGVTVYSDVSVATAISGDAKGEFSYAAFFEKPVKWGSFIKEYDGDIFGPIRFRPFMEELSAFIQSENENSAIHALVMAFKKRIPGIRGKAK